MSMSEQIVTSAGVVFHIYYTAVDGGATLKGYVEQNNIDNQPTVGVKVFSARNDFGAPAPTAANPYALSAWDTFLTKPAGADPDQSLVVSISASKFPIWTRGKTISISTLTILSVGWPPESFVLEPEAPLIQAPPAQTWPSQRRHRRGRMTRDLRKASQTKAAEHRLLPDPRPRAAFATFYLPRMALIRVRGETSASALR
jgi:hypothetical protein